MSVSFSKKKTYIPIIYTSHILLQIIIFIFVVFIVNIHLLLFYIVGLPRVLEPTYFAYSTNDGLGYKSNEDTTDELTSSINLTREVLSSSGSVSDWIEPSMHICNSKLLQSYGSNRVYDAFHLLQTEPSIQVP